MKKYAVIVAAGSGTRMGREIPKQFLSIADRPILFHTLDTFLSAYKDMELILVLPPKFMQWGVEIVKALPEPQRISLVEGGNTRFKSVKNGLALVKEHSVVFVHDGVRCLITGQLIHHCYEQAIVKGSAIPAVAATETVRLVEGENHRMINRNTVRLVQTPQTFLSTLLLKAFEGAEQDSFTDEASVVEASGEKVYLIEGEYTNIKITRPQDLAVAEQILKLRGVTI
jgi:2-C-methyl-D-erythritol 4-phosphate cytidylyltransferase